LAKGYRKLPKPIRKGTGNMVNNLSNLITIPNNLLQGQLQQAGLNTLRFTLNTTIGILGFFDPANGLGLKAVGKEDYGQTLGAWGSHSGCYFVLPVLGPTTVRDFTGTVINFVGGDPWYNVTVRQDTNYFRDRDFYISRATNSVDFRAKNIESFDSLERNSIDFYASVKSLYLQDRKKKVGNSDSITETQDDSDWEEINNN
jgi:phospholipid-binding lipoprotein MlaA